MSPQKIDVSGDSLLAGLPVDEGLPVLGGVALRQRLGRGGMGAVYRGRHLRLGIDVAVKIMALPATVPADQADAFVKRFTREAQNTAAVPHENLVRIYDVNSEHGLHFLVMDFVDGESAAETLKRKGPLSEEEAARIVLGAAEGLAAAHRKGIVHRDVKPDNIMIDREGRVLVTDLGLAKSYSEDSDLTALTQDGIAMGTPAYMPPEQFFSAKDVGSQADVWALGVTLYRLLTGEAPWSGTSPYDLARKIESSPLPDVRQLRPDLSEGLRAVLVTCLQKDPAKRYRDCGEMAAALRQAASGAPVVAASEELAGPTRIGSRNDRHPGRPASSDAAAARPSWETTILLQLFGLGLFYLRPKSLWRFVYALILPSMLLPVVVYGVVGVVHFGLVELLAPLLLHLIASILVLFICHDDRSGTRVGGWRALTVLAALPVLAAVVAVIVSSLSVAQLEPVAPGASFSPEELRSSLEREGQFVLPEDGDNIFDLSSVAFSPDGKLLATASIGLGYAWWDLTTGQRVGAVQEEDRPSLLMNHPVAFAPDGEHLVVAREDATAVLWSVATDSKVRTFRGHQNQVIAADFSADGRYLATAAESDKTVALWDVSTGERLRRLQSDWDFYAVAFSPDGRLLATGSSDAGLWDVATGEQLRTLPNADGAVMDVAFSADGKRLATASNNHVAVIWDVETGEKQLSLEDHPEAVFAVAFSPDGRYVATGSLDKTAALWDATTGKRLAWLEGHTGSVTSVAFSPDGRLLATASSDRTVRLWRVGAFVRE